MGKKKWFLKILNIEEIRTQGINWERYLQDTTGKYTESYSELTKRWPNWKLPPETENKTGSVTMVKTTINETRLSIYLINKFQNV